MVSQSRLHHRVSSRAIFFLMSLLLMLTLVGCESTGVGTTNPSPTSSTSVATSTATTTPAAASAPTPTPIPTSTPASSSAPFRVNGISISVDQSTFTGICGDTVVRTFTAAIFVPAHSPGGTVTYHWSANGGGVTPAQTVTFAPGQTSQTVTETTHTGANWGDGSQQWMMLTTIAPNSWNSAHATFSFVCQRVITGIHASVTSQTFACDTTPYQFQLSATVTVSPGPGSVTVTYHWTRSDGGTGATSMVTLSNGQTTATISTSWSLGAIGTPRAFWEEVIASSPNAVTSNQAAFSMGVC